MLTNLLLESSRVSFEISFVSNSNRITQDRVTAEIEVALLNGSWWSWLLPVRYL